MKKGDIIWSLVLVMLIAILVVPVTHTAFMQFTTQHPYLGGFIKFGILATMGELLAIRIVSGEWNIPKGVLYRALIWGFLGMVIVLVFDVFGSGVNAALSKGMLPGKGSKFAFAFFVSAIMNMTFAPTMMAFHRITDTYLDLKYQGDNKKITIGDVVRKVQWDGFVSFVILKTIPIFWIPAHTITFMVSPEYRVLVAASLSMALGLILAFAKKKPQNVKL